MDLASEVLLPTLVQEVAALALRSMVGRALQPGVPSAGEGAPCRRPELGAVPILEVVSDLPGRTRLRLAGLRGDRSRAAQVADRFRALDGVLSAEASSVTGTVLVHYDPDRLSLVRIVSSIRPPRLVARRQSPVKLPRAGRPSTAPCPLCSRTEDSLQPQLLPA